eukprot:5890525-Pleurochrysis_carterae.AAC.1
MQTPVRSCRAIRRTARRAQTIPSARDRLPASRGQSNGRNAAGAAANIGIKTAHGASRASQPATI